MRVGEGRGESRGKGGESRGKGGGKEGGRGRGGGGCSNVVHGKI